jgi:dolichyl-phosphate beta-glucosyltransferase
MNPLLSVVIPTYNEANRIEKTLLALKDFLDTQPLEWEIIISDDGSTDTTRTKIATITQNIPQARLIASEHGGKGRALKAGISQSLGEYIFLFDADMSMPVRHLLRFLPPYLENFDIAIGSRNIPGSRKALEPWSRSIQGRIFNKLVQLIAISGISDTQCGFKCLRAAPLRPLVENLQIDGFAFDVELLMSAQQHGLSIIEVPIDWFYIPGSRVRPFVDPFTMLCDLIRLRYRRFNTRGTRDKPHSEQPH